MLGNTGLGFHGCFPKQVCLRMLLAKGVSQSTASLHPRACQGDAVLQGLSNVLFLYQRVK